MNRLTTRALGACLFTMAAFTPWAQAADGLTLRQAVDAALGGNPELQTFAFQFQALDARARQAALRPAPELSIDVENVLGTGAVKGTDAAEYTFALSQVIELGGKRDARIAAAQASRSTADLERQARQLDVLAEVTRRFISVATQQEQLQLARKATQLAQRTVNGAQRRVDAAKSPHAELDRARIALDRAKLDERRAETELDTARRQLAATWGESKPVISGRLMGEVQADLFSLPDAGDFESLSTRLASSPDFLRFASEARLRDAELRLAATTRKPDLTLGGGFRRFQEGGDQGFVASVSIPLFGSRRAESFIAEAQANRDLVSAEQRVAEVKARAMLYELHRELSRAVAEAQSLRTDILPRTEEALRETEYAFDRGRYSYLELVDAQREYLDLQASLIEASANAHSLRAEIERLTNAPLAASTPEPN